MAGSPANIRLSSFMRQRRLPPKMQMPLLVKSSITINGRKFTTMIREGASAEELIAKVAKENGGGVARVYYPEFKTHEIVAVKIGEQLIVKGDPDRVRDGDFSEFDDGDSVKSAAVAASASSKGGIHFFVGSDGIPMAAAEKDGVVFPNAQELRVNTNINNLSLAVVDYNVNPNSMRDINRLYRKGANISQSAKEEIEKSHGGVRSEKLMLPDTSVLILNRESGDIRTASEFASSFRAEGFMFKPAAPQQFFVPQHVHKGLALPTDLGVMHIPFDGSSAKVPYLCVKVFDGKVTDAIKVVPCLPEEAPRRRRKKPEPAPQPQRIPAPRFPGQVQATEFRAQEEVKIKPPKAETILSHFNSPRPAQIKLVPAKPKVPSPKADIQEPNPKADVLGPKAAKIEKPPSPAKANGQRAKKPIRQESKTESPRKKGRKPKPARAAARAKPARKKASAAKKSGKKPGKAAKPKRKKPRAAKPKPAKAPKKAAKPKRKKPSKPKAPGKGLEAGKPKAQRKRKKARKKKPDTELVKIAANWSAKKMSKKKRKKIQSYYLNTMLGLFKSKRSGAGSSRRRKKASRT